MSGGAAAARERYTDRRVTDRFVRFKRALLGDRPLVLLGLAAPTALALVLDLSIRGGAIAGFATQAKLIYASSLLISAAFWVESLWFACWLMSRGSPRARGATAAVFGLWILPFATCSYGGQALYHRVFQSYIGRDTVRLGVALRGTIGDWFRAWGGPWLLAGMVSTGALVAVALFVLVRRAAPRVGSPVPLLPVLTFCGAAFCFWTDQVDSRFLQAATPDACFIHGTVHALRTWIEGRGQVRQGMSLRSPAPLPALSSAHRPNVVLILTESVRADATCSDPPPACTARFLDLVAADRVPLGKLTSQRVARRRPLGRSIRRRRGRGCHVPTGT